MTDGMAQAPMAVGPKHKRMLSQRLMLVLTGEVRVLERVFRAGAAADGGDGGALTVGAKGRLDAIGSLTRTLEKLIEVGRAELAVAKGGAEEEREAERLRAEFIKRLRAIDAKRGGGRRLFAQAAPA